MKRGVLLLALAAVFPAALVGQEPDLRSRLGEALSPEVADRVLARIDAAADRRLPTTALANLALEGVAKGRSGDEVLAALESMAADLGRARDAVVAAGRAPVRGDVEAATAAMRMGVDGEAVRSLAGSHPQGRSMAVPLLLMAGLTERGLPSDRALAAVQERIAAGAGDAELLGDFPEVARGLGPQLRPDPAGLGLGGGVGRFGGPNGGVGVPTGPPGKPDGLPGRRPKTPPGQSGGS